MENLIKVRGARQHNLKNIDLDIPKNKLVCFTGVSGSGKSSLAFDTIYAEGQRRYVESLSTYARQFLGLMEKPDVDSISGLSPAISIDQKTTSKNPRSTVGTITEVYDYLRLLFARVGHPHCPICGGEISGQSLDEIVNAVDSLIESSAKKKKVSRFLILSPIVTDKKGEFSSLFDNLKIKGFRYVRVDGYIKSLAEDFLLIKTNKHTIDVLVDRVSLGLNDLKSEIFKNNLKSRLSESIEKALKLSEGLVIFSEVLDNDLEMPEYPKKFQDHLFSERFACPIDNIQLPEIEPRSFSFNSPHGACSTCGGIGKILKIDKEFLFSDEISITEGGILPFANIFEHDTWYSRLLLTVCREFGIDPKLPLKDLTSEQKQILLNGTGDREYKVEGTNRFGKSTYIYEVFSGIVSELESRHASTDSDWVRGEIEKYMREMICPGCSGLRLKKESLAITIEDLSISEVTSFSIKEGVDWINHLSETNSPLSLREKEIGDLIVKEIFSRLQFLLSVGLEYLTLDRSAGTLSGGEAQRIRLASQIGSGLTGVLYVLDEPTIGLHQKDNERLIVTLKTLRDLGNTVIVVEHDAQTIQESDFVVDFGPGAGKLGGSVVAAGTPVEIINNPDSITGRYLNGKREIIVKNEDFGQNELESKQGKKINTENEAPRTDAQGIFSLLLRRERNPSEAEISSHSSTGLRPRFSAKGDKNSLILHGCSQYNLKNINVNFPLKKFVVLTGVSGSGKSTLLVETLYPALSTKFNRRFKGFSGSYTKMEGSENVDKVILIDQSPIGRTPRSNPATYTKVFDPIRDTFALTKEARAAGFKKGRFSFNVRGGRCESCEGQGQIKIEMQFMSDIWVTCEVCRGKRYNSQTLEITYRGKNIAEVLDLTVSETLEFFHSIPPIFSKLETLEAVGLGYMQLGQSATTLSGGEAQRVKLASELMKKETGNTVYILDEPTTGLHFADVEKLLRVLKLLVARGNSVFVIEHNPDVIKNSDWIIDLGPEGGLRGGLIVAQGTVSDIKKVKESYTGQFLAKTSRLRTANYLLRTSD